ncbi:MAG TPA: hypothetical protein VFT45_21295, partial [Longimicrobium sp.]|nr:hypothetical protein [Longimicrobium sp.]
MSQSRLEEERAGREKFLEKSVAADGFLRGWWPALHMQLKPRSASVASRDGAYRFPSSGFTRSSLAHLPTHPRSESASRAHPHPP